MMSPEQIELFERILKTKIQGGDVSPVMSLMTKQELLELKEWIRMQKANIELKDWKSREALRAIEKNA